MAAGDAAQLSELPTYVGNVLTFMIPLVGIVSFIMILVGGFRILTAGGNSDGIKKGGQTITMAIAGIALAIVSWLVLVFVRNVTGVDVTNFQFGF